MRNTQYTTQGVKLLNVANLVDGEIDLSTSDRYISEEEAYGKYRHFLCDVGDFIVASSGIKVEYIDKKMGFIDETMLPLCMNTSTIRFKVLDINQLSIRYFMYYLKSHHFKDQLAHFITGSAQLNYGPSHLSKMTMPLIDLPEQEIIVERLDKLQSIITHRKQQLEKLDELVKARFVEMFGDVISNSKKWNCYIWNDILTIKNGRNQKQVENPNGKYLICGSGGVMGHADEYITSENSVIIGRKGNINKPILMKEKFWNVDTAFGLEPNVAIIDVNYLFNFCIFFDFEKLNKAVTIPSLTKTDLLKIEMPVPPLDLQTQFADFVKQADKSKFIAEIIITTIRRVRLYDQF